MTKEQNKKAPNLRFKSFTNDWEQRKLGDVAKVTMGQSPSSKNYTDNPNDYVLVQGNADLKSNEISPRVWTKEVTKQVHEGEFIMTVRAPVGYLAMANMDAVIGRGVAAIDGNKYLYYLLQTKLLDRTWEKLSSGSTFESISSNDIKNLEIKVTETEEEKLIAKLMNTVTYFVTLQQRKLELLSQLKQGLIQQNILNQALLNSSSSWPSYKLKDLLKVRKKLQIPDIKYPLASFTVEKGVTSKTSRYNREFLVQTHNKKYKSTEYHDIVYNPANLKFGAIALNKFGKATISPIYETLVPSSKCNVYFLTLIITSPDFIHKALKYQEGTVYERMAVKVNDLLSMSIHLPNIDTQVKFGEFFYGLDELIYATKNKLEKYQLIKKSLLQQMFI